MTEENIWENLDLSEDKLITAYDLLISQADNFSKKTKGELTMYVESNRTTSGDSAKREMTLHTLYVVVPALGDFRKRILYAVEFHDTGRFPVNIFCKIDNTMTENVDEESFLKTIKAILSRPSVINSIENLYRQSVEAKKK